MTQPYQHPQRGISLTVPDGETSVTLNIDMRRTAPWFQPLAAATLQLAAATGTLLVRVNDSPPTSVSDTTRGDVRTISALSYDNIRGVRVNSLGLRYDVDEAVEADTKITVNILGWTVK